MPIKSYRKVTSYAAPVTYKTEQSPQVQIVSSISDDQDFGANASMWSFMADCYRGLKSIVATSTMAGLIIPALFIFTGLGFIYLQFQPAIVEQVKEYAGYYDQGTASLVQEGYMPDRLQYVSNPGADYFQRVSQAALRSNTMLPDPKSNSYSGILYLTIPSLGFNRLPVTANVESNTKDAYTQVLRSSLAHFQGTGLPESDVDNNIVIYGHSAGGAYNPSPNDVLAAFTFLSDMRVGDEIMLEMNGVQYKYRMTRSKIVEPTDTSVITGTPGKETLTLFTCHPPGNNSNRLVISATPLK